jgi:hypothetical protein
MEYSKAAKIRKKGLLSLIAEKKFEEGQGLGSSIGGAISEKFKARAVGMKEKMDPLRWISAMAGQGTFGKITTTALGRTFGRSEDTIKYFGGYGKKKRKDKKDPEFTTIGSGSITNLRVGDSVANILGKMYIFMRKTYEKQKTNYELEVSFRKEQLEEDERRHKKLIATLTGKKPPEEKKDGEDESKSFIDKLIDGIKKSLGPVLSGLWSIVNSLGSIVMGIMGKISGVVVSIVSAIVGSFIGTAIGGIFKSLNKMIGVALVKAISAFSGAVNSLGLAAAIKGWPGLVAKLFGVGVLAAEAGSAQREYRDFKYGEESELLSDEISRLEQPEPGTDYVLPENLERVEVLKKKRQEAREENYKKILTPAMEFLGWKDTGKRDKEDGSPIYEKDGQKASWTDIASSGLITKTKDSVINSTEEMAPKILEKARVEAERLLEPIVSSGQQQWDKLVQTYNNQINKTKSEESKPSVEVQQAPPMLPPEPKPIPKVEEPVPQSSSSNGGNNIQVNTTSSVSTGGDTQYVDSILVRNNDDSYVTPTIRVASFV